MSEEQTQPKTETITLPSGGSIPGIPGSHGPGTYIVNWIERSIVRVEEALHLRKSEPDPVAKPSQTETPSPVAPESTPSVTITLDPTETELPSTMK